MKNLSSAPSIPALLAAALLLAGAPGAQPSEKVETQVPKPDSSSQDETARNRPELALARNADYDYDPPAPGSYTLPVLDAAADGAVLDAEGKAVGLHQLFKDRIVVLSFIYTRCTDPRACLRASGVLRQLQTLSRNDPELSKKLLLVTLSFDPAYDTPNVIGRYGRVFNAGQTGADWLFLTTRSQADLQPILAAYDQRVDKRQRPSPLGPYYHPLRVYLIDGQKQIRNIYSYGLLDPRLVMTDVRTLCLEANHPAPGS